MAEEGRKLTPVEWIVSVACVVGVVLAVALAMNATGIYLWSSHMADVIADAWTTTATIGLIVALTVASLVGVFVWVLAKSTLGSDPAEE